MNIFKKNKCNESEVYIENAGFSIDSGSKNMSDADSYSLKLRGLSLQIMPKVEDSCDSQKQLLHALCDAMPFLSSVEDNAESAYWEHFDGTGANFKVVSQIALDVDKYLNFVPSDVIDCALESSDTKKLVEAWGVLDFYMYMLKAEYCINLRSLQGRITEFLYENDLKIECEHLTDLEILLREYTVLCGKGKTVELDIYVEKKAEIIRKMFSADAVYVVYDKSSQTGCPYINNDGNAEVYTNERYAVEAKRKHEKAGADTEIKKICGENLRKFFEDADYFGITGIIINKDCFSVVLNVDELCRAKGFVIDCANREMRYTMLRRLQAQSRYNRRGVSQINLQKAYSYKNIINKLRKTLSEQIGDAIVYVLVEGASINGVTLYSKKAYEIVSGMLKNAGTDETSAMTYPGNLTCGVADSIHKIGVVNVAGRGAYGCVFTNMASADKVRKQFADGGTANNIVAVAFDEVAPLLKQCDGMAVDISDYGYLVSRDEMDTMAQI